MTEPDGDDALDESVTSAPFRHGAPGDSRNDFGSALRAARLERELADDFLGLKRRRLAREGAFGPELQARVLAEHEQSDRRWRNTHESTHCQKCERPLGGDDVTYRPNRVSGQRRARDPSSGRYYQLSPLCVDCAWPALREIEPEPCVVCGRSVVQESRYRRRYYGDEEWRLRWDPPICVCSPRCASRHYGRVQHEPRVCDACGETFTPQRSDARYCSQKCKQRAYRRRVTDTS